MGRFRRKGKKAVSPHKSPRLSAEHCSNSSATTTTSLTSLAVVADRKGSSTDLACGLREVLSIEPDRPSQLPKPKHIPIELSPYQTKHPVSPGSYSGGLQYRIATSSPRPPRHVPIIIPEFAQPFIPDPVSTSGAIQSELSLGPDTRHIRCKAALTHENPESPKPPQDHTGASQVLHSGRYDLPAMNSSQVSLSTASESGADNASIPSRSTSHASNDNNNRNNVHYHHHQQHLGITSPVSQASGSSNLSALVCNVHRTTGQEPHALVGATTTILGDKLYVFGGRIHSRSKPQLTSDMYELDLLRRHWTKLDVSGDVPPPRYFHSVCALGDSKLVCYGGMSPALLLRNSQSRPQAADGQPEVVVMSDIHIFDVPKRRWFLVSGSTVGTDEPQGRYAHCAAVLPSSAIFSSSTAPHSAIHHNRPASEGSSAHSGTLGVQLDGSGGAEMVVVGGQDSANNYIEQISVFNLRSLKWTSTSPYDHKCGAYKSMVAPLSGLNAEDIGQGVPLDDPSRPRLGTSTLIYSNYNFLEVKLELQIRLPDGSLIERPMKGRVSPPGLRFPNGGVINGHFVVSGTYLTSSKHEYALWALDLKTLTWGRIETAGSIFSQASWNRGVLWNRRNTFIMLGHRKRNLVEDYNHRRINFSHICTVELEAFGLYENPRKIAPTSSYVSMSVPAVPTAFLPYLPTVTAGGRQMSAIAEQLGQTALVINEMSDMELVAVNGERIPCNSNILARRWGPYFHQLLVASSTHKDSMAVSEATTLRNNMHSQASRNSILTITPSAPNGPETASLAESTPASIRSMSASTSRTLVEVPTSSSVPASSRARALYLPHTTQTIHLLLHFLYTSSLPPLTSPLCSPHTLCSLLQMARPYQVDGLLEATVQRLHEALDGRNAAAVFNAAAMAAGGGRHTGKEVGGTLVALEQPESRTTPMGSDPSVTSTDKASVALQVDQSHKRGHSKSNSVDSTSTATSTSTSAGLSQTDTELSAHEGEETRRKERKTSIWTGDVSAVIGLQKRGLRGLMEGRRLRERANTAGTGDS